MTDVGVPQPPDAEELLKIIRYKIMTDVGVHLYSWI